MVVGIEMKKMAGMLVKMEAIWKQKNYKVDKKRFNELFDKYRLDRLTQLEYQELLELLHEPGMETELDQLLNQYWKNIVLDELSEKPDVRNPRKYRMIENWWNWAIAASLLLLFSLFFYQTGLPEFLQKKDIVYQTGFGERMQITLNDGSLITLNANSKLKWDENWEHEGKRIAILDGEAFFEVEKKNGIPFTVETEDVSVVVLGTSFNVDSREEKTEVYLEEGKVNLKLRNEPDLKNVKASREIVMKPGDQVRYSVREKKVERSEGQTMITAAAWKNNVLNFKNMKFSEVLNLLREIYGQSFECSDSKLLGTPMYLGVPYSDWEAVRQALELSLNVEFEEISVNRYLVKKP